MQAEPLRNCRFCFKTGSYSAAQAGLELMTNLLPQSSGCWDYKYKPPHWVYTLIFWAVTCSFPTLWILDLPCTKWHFGAYSRLIQKFSRNFQGWVRLLFFEVPTYPLQQWDDGEHPQSQHSGGACRRIKSSRSIFIPIASIRLTWSTRDPVSKNKYLCILWPLLFPGF